MVTSLSSPDRELYRWQLDALVSWLRCGRRGVIEAVTGSGKTDVAIAAAADALRRGRFVLVRRAVAGAHGAVARPAARRAARRADRAAGRQRAATARTSCDVLVATRHSAAAYKPVPPGAAGGLLIADECHGLGGGTLRRAMLPQYEERLGLTATLERSDDAVTELLLPYFGGICYRYGFEQAIADGVCARPRVAFVGVALSVEERAEYVADRAAARERAQPPPRRPRHAARAVRRLPRRGRASRRARRRAPTAAPRATTSTRSPSGARSWRSRAASTSCSAASPRRSRTPTARWCSPRRCAPRTTRSTGSIRSCRST